MYMVYKWIHFKITKLVCSLKLICYNFRAMLGCEELQRYDRARVFLDEDYTAADKFTVNYWFVQTFMF